MRDESWELFKKTGLPQAYWVGMDYGDVLVHIFIPEARNFYNLEDLWQDAAVTEVPNID